MPVITWKEEYSVGVRELDQGHKQLIAMINELHYAMQNDSGQKVVTGIIVEMIQYAKDHMTLEESYMQQVSYLGLLQHHREHKNFIDKANDLKLRSEGGEFVLSFEVLQFLSDWLKEHILETDMKYVPLFKEQGLSKL